MLRILSLERVETSRNVTELIPWSFPHKRARLDHSVLVLIKDGATEISKMQ